MFGSPVRSKTKKDDLSPSMHSSWAPCDSQNFKMPSQPVTMPSHRRSKSSLEYRGSPSSTSFSTADTVLDVVDQPSAVQPDLQQKKRASVPENADEDMLIEIATQAFIKELGLADDSILKGAVLIREVAAGTYLMKEESNKVSFNV